MAKYLVKHCPKNLQEAFVVYVIILPWNTFHKHVFFMEWSGKYKTVINTQGW